MLETRGLRLTIYPYKNMNFKEQILRQIRLGYALKFAHGQGPLLPYKVEIPKAVKMSRIS